MPSTTRADSELVDPAYLNEGRLYVRIVGDGLAAGQVERLATEVNGLRLLGLPVRVLTADNGADVAGPAMLVNVALSAGKTSETKAKLELNKSSLSGRWMAFGKTAFVENVPTTELDGKGLVRAIDRAISSTFVTVKTAGRSASATSLKLENKLPFTLANIEIKTGNSSGSPIVPFSGLGIGPARTGIIAIQAPGGKVEHVELNGL